MYKRPVIALAYSTPSSLLRQRTARFFAQRFHDHSTYSYQQIRAAGGTRDKRRILNGRTSTKASEAILSQQQVQVQDVALKLQDRTLPVETIIQAYQDIQSLPSAPLTLRLCQWIHAAHRYRRSERKKTVQADIRLYGLHDQQRKSIEAFADQIATHLKERKLPLHPWAILHLLSFYKEAELYTKGVELWSWATKQEDDHLSPAVYSAAIELLSESGGHSLQELEELFLEGLRRWPGDFAEYHFSPNAVVPNRSRLTNTRGLPMALLQAVMVARVVHGDWRNAILALDSALRLYPTSIPIMFFTLMIHERPLSEAYHMAHMACRALVPLQPATLTYVLKAIADLGQDFERKRNIKNEKLEERVGLIGAMLELLAAYDAAGGALSAEHVSLAVNCVSDLAINLQYATDAEESTVHKFAKYNKEILELAEHLVQLFGDVRQLHSLPAYNSLIVLAGKTKDRALAGQYASKIVDKGYQPTDVTFRSLINAAGKCGDLDTLNVAWEALVENSGKQEQSGPARLDWFALAVAVRDSRLIAANAFLEREMAKHNLPDELRTTIRRKLTRQITGETLDPGIGELKFSQSIVSLKEIVARFEKHLRKAQPGKHDFYHHPFQTHIFPEYTQIKADEAQLRLVYDEMSTDPDRPEGAETGLPAEVDANGFPIAELRFENWCSVNELLATAEAFERFKEKYIDDAITEGKAAPNLKNRDPRPWLKTKSDPATKESQVEVGSPAMESNESSRIRRRIRSLRGLS